MGDKRIPSSPSLADLPADELGSYARELGLTPEPQTPRDTLIRLIRERHELLLDLDHAALLDVAAWARLPVRRSAGKESLARHIAGISKNRFDGLSHRGLIAFARLRGLTVSKNGDREALERQLRRQAGWWTRLQRKRRSLMGDAITYVVESAKNEDEYRFLPENGEGDSLKQKIENAGVVGGIAQKLRGVADQYVHEKLDEIERRIDRKLDEIDRRLTGWRDQEIGNRLRIIKITLIAAIVVAAISLGYDYIKSKGGIVTPPDESTVKMPLHDREG